MLAFAAASCACGAPYYRFPGPLGSMGVAPESAKPTAKERRLAAQPEERPLRRSETRWGERVARAAEEQIGKPKPENEGVCFRDDCTGLVQAAYAAIDLELKGSCTHLYAQARDSDLLHQKREPYPGDVVFFDNTYDSNGNKRFDDPTTHVGVVTSVDRDGTIHFVHNGNSGILPLVMNLGHAELRNDDSGKRLNDYLRVKKRKDPKDAKYLAGELWTGFASFWKMAGKGGPDLSLLIFAPSSARTRSSLQPGRAGRLSRGPTPLTEPGSTRPLLQEGSA